MPLRWTFGGAVIDGGTFAPGKVVTLEALNHEPRPNELYVSQVYSSAMQQMLRYIGVRDRNPGPTFAATQVSDDCYQSDHGWSLPVPRGWRKSTAYVFTTDSSSDESARVYCSRLGRVAFDLGGGANLKAPLGPIPIGVEGKASLKCVVEFAVDPTVGIEVLAGERLVDHMIENLKDYVQTAHDAGEFDLAGRADASMREVRDTLNYAYRIPNDWAITAEVAHVHGDAGEQVSFEIEFDLQSPGSANFAVAALDTSDVSVGDTSDTWGLRVDADLTVSVLANPGETELPRPAFA